MSISTIRLLDYIVSAARAASRPTLVVRIENEGATSSIDIELDMLSEDACAALKADNIAIIEFESDQDLERMYELVQHKRDADSSYLQLRADFIPSGGRTKSWNTPRW